MDFDNLFTEQKTVDCGRERQIIGVIVFLNIVGILVDCVLACKRHTEIKLLTKENESLKSIILKSVDRAFVRMMKNGNNWEDEHQE